MSDGATLNVKSTPDANGGMLKAGGCHCLPQEHEEYSWIEKFVSPRKCQYALYLPNIHSLENNTSKSSLQHSINPIFSTPPVVRSCISRRSLLAYKRPITYFRGHLSVIQLLKALAIIRAASSIASLFWLLYFACTSAYVSVNKLGCLTLIMCARQKPNLSSPSELKTKLVTSSLCSL
jgi:hypothetical protein